MRRRKPFSLRRLIRYAHLRLKRMPGHIDEVAGGVAIGVFFGCSPLQGTQILCAVTVAHLLKRNKLVAAISTTFTNPITTIPFMGLEYFVGTLIVGGGRPELPPELLAATTFSEVVDGVTTLGMEVAVPLVVGAFVMAAILTPISYVLARRSLIAYRKVSAKRRHKRYVRTHPAGEI